MPSATRIYFESQHNLPRPSSMTPFTAGGKPAPVGFALFSQGDQRPAAAWVERSLGGALAGALDRDAQGRTLRCARAAAAPGRTCGSSSAVCGEFGRNQPRAHLWPARTKLAELRALEPHGPSGSRVPPWAALVPPPGNYLNSRSNQFGPKHCRVPLARVAGHARPLGHIGPAAGSIQGLQRRRQFAPQDHPQAQLVVLQRLAEHAPLVLTEQIGPQRVL